MNAKLTCITPFMRQAWTVSGVLLNMMGQSMVLSFTTSLLPALRDPNSSIHADLNTASMLASIVGIAGIPGFLIGSFLMDWRGRRFAHFAMVIPGVVGWIMVYFANDITMLMIGRFLNGMAGGSTVCLGAVVIGEYSSPKNRGMFLNLKTASVCLGSTIVHILSCYYTWRTIALQALIPHIVSLIIIYTWPESPAWFASKKQFEKCEKAFDWLRGRDEQSLLELEELLIAQKERAKEVNTQKSISVNIITYFKKFTKKDFIKPVLITFLGVVLLEASGRHIFSAYALQIIEEITGDKTDKFYYTLGIDIIITLSATFSSVLVKLINRRTLLFTTGFAAVIVLLSVCVYLFLESIKIVSNNHVWIPISMFIVYFIFANLGCTPIPLGLLGEIFPLAHRGAGSAVAGVMLSTGVTFGLQVTPYLMVHLKMYGTFAVLSATMAFALCFMYFILPETKDRTLQEIEDYFMHGQFKVKNRRYSDIKEVQMKILD